MVFKINVPAPGGTIKDAEQIRRLSLQLFRRCSFDKRFAYCRFTLMYRLGVESLPQLRAPCFW
jgi:hypothetical protein